LASLEKALIAQGGDGNMIWENSKSWSVPEDVLDKWIAEAAEGLAYAIISATCLIDVERAIIDGWLPKEVRARIVRQATERLDQIHIAGIDLPVLREGTIGSDARSMGAASLPLADRFMVDSRAFLKGERIA
jgi:predicted NBD/HSP70 family sugar kinase